MASTQALSAAAQDRKSRLAQLKSLKRKQPSSDDHDKNTYDASSTLVTPTDLSSSERLPKSPRRDDESGQIQATETAAEGMDVTAKYLSGRNYDRETKNAKLGFDSAPSGEDGSTTLEVQAAALAAETQQQAETEAQADRPLDLFALQPKKPNWDLKRDLERKLEILNVRTDNAIARLVRERIAAQKGKRQSMSNQSGTEADGEVDGIAEGGEGLEGATLVEATNVREREDEEEARREREEEDALLDAS